MRGTDGNGQRSGMTESTEPSASSQVTLVGRLGRQVGHRVLPSGDELTVFTIVIDRPPVRDARTPGPSVDAISCQTSRAVVVRRLAALGPGDWVRAEGTLRRRFWRSPGGLASVTEVDVSRLARLGGRRASMGG